MSFAEERKRTIREINNQNKRRARQMEQRVAKFLRGNRVPMSGAGSIKGDCMVINDKFGMILIECKTSSQRDTHGNARIRLNFDWLIKLDADVKATRARMGVLVIHYHDARTDYVIMRSDLYTQVGGTPPTKATTFFTEKHVGFLLKRAVLDDALKDSPEQIALLSNKSGDYVILTLDKFRDLIEAE